MTSDDLLNFLTRETTFHDLCTTLMTNGDNILMTLKTNCEDTLTTKTTDGEHTLTTPFMTHDYLMTNPHDISDNPCGVIDDLYDIHSQDD
jgi:hypothetical protein